MKVTAFALIVAALAVGGSALAAERAPQGMPDPGIFARFLSRDSPECVPMKAITLVGAQIMPLKDGSFRFLEGVFTLIPPVSHELPPGDKAVLAVGPKGEMMAAIIDGDQSCARFMIPAFLQEIVAGIESGNEAPKAGKGL